MRKLISLVVSVLALGILSAASFGHAPEIRDGLFQSDEAYAFDYSGEASGFWDEAELSLFTASPAEPVYIYFGHTGIVLTLPGKESMLYDYGTFSFGPGFYTNFALGRLYYDLSSGRFERKRSAFEDDDRTMSLLDFGFTPEQKQGVAAFLGENSKPENSTYLYHYYLDNCATRVRDIYDAAEGGAFRLWAEGIDTGESFRDYARRYLSPSLFFNLLLNYLQGPAIDYDLTLWEACFLPDVLRDSIESYSGNKPMEIYTTETRKPVPESYQLEPRAAALGLVLALIVLLGASEKRTLRTISDMLSGLFYIFLGLCSVLLLLIMLFTNHDVAYGNINWMIISPLNLFLGINRLRSLGRSSRRESLFVFSGASLALAIAALIFQLCTPFSQDNASYYILAFLLYIPEFYIVERT